jgi:hypothetical protein
MIQASNPGMKGQPQAGLAALAQPAQAPRGMSSGSMQEIIARARQMSDSQLADILSGKSMAVPQYVAMTEAMGRKSLRTAMQGAQAQQQAKQPSVKDRLLAENAPQQMMQEAVNMDPQQSVMAAEGGLMYADGGIAAIPAPNMDSVDMASGGIVAFQDNEDQPVRVGMPSEPVFGSPEYNEKYGAPGSLKRRFKSVRDYYASPSSLEGVGRNIDNTMTALGPAAASRAAFNLPKTGTVSSAINRLGNFLGLSGTAEGVLGGGQSQALPVPEGAAEEVKPPVKDATADAKAGPAGSAGKGDDSSDKGGLSNLASFDDLIKKRTTDYLSKFEGLGDKRREGLKALKNQIQGQLALQGSSALLGSRNLAEAGSKFGQQAASTVAAGRAEQRSVEDAADAYDFNIAKAREAAEKGDIQLALQYQQLANQNKYQMGSLDVARQRNAIMGEAGNLGKVQLGLKNADAQALAEAKQRFPVVTKTNQAAFDAFLRKRANELKMQNPLTKQYANLNANDVSGMDFNVVQSLPKGASVVDLG